MATTAGINIHVDPSEISRKHHPADSECHEYGTLTLGKPGHGACGNIFFDTADPVAVIDKVIAELVALRAEMAPPVITDSERTCPAMNDGWHCHRSGDHDEHEDDNGDRWRTGGEGLCDSELPLKHGGSLACVKDAGHYGMHSAVGGSYRWLGHGADARDEQGGKIAPVSVPA